MSNTGPRPPNSPKPDSLNKFETLAPEGQVWWCPECGRISADREGQLAVQPGWTEHCSGQAVLIHQDDMVLDERGRVIEATIMAADHGESAERIAGILASDEGVPDAAVRRVREDATDVLSVLPFGNSREIVLVHRGHNVSDVLRVTLDDDEIGDLFSHAVQNFFRWANDDGALEINAIHGAWNLRFMQKSSQFSGLQLELTRPETHELCQALFEQSV